MIKIMTRSLIIMLSIFSIVLHAQQSTHTILSKEVTPFNLIQAGDSFDSSRVTFVFDKVIKGTPTFKKDLNDSIFTVTFDSPHAGVLKYPIKLLPLVVTKKEKAVGFLEKKVKGNFSDEFETVIFNKNTMSTDLTFRLSASAMFDVSIFIDGKELFLTPYTKDYNVSIGPNKEVSVKLKVVSDHYFKKQTVTLKIVRAMNLKTRCSIVGSSFKVELTDNGPIIYNPLTAHIPLYKLEKDSSFQFSLLNQLPIKTVIADTNPILTSKGMLVEYISSTEFKYTIPQNRKINEFGLLDEFNLNVKNEHNLERLVPVSVYIASPASKRSIVNVDLSEVTHYVDTKKLSSPFGYYYKPFAKVGRSTVLKPSKIAFSKLSKAVDTRRVNTNVSIIDKGDLSKARKTMFTSAALIKGIKENFVLPFSGVTLHYKLKVPSPTNPKKKVDSIFNVGAIAIAPPVLDSVFVISDAKNNKYVVFKGRNINLYRSESSTTTFFFFKETSYSYQCLGYVEYIQTNGKRKQYTLGQASTNLKLNIPNVGEVKNGDKGYFYFKYNSILKKDYKFEAVVYNRASYAGIPFIDHL